MSRRLFFVLLSFPLLVVEVAVFVDGSSPKTTTTTTNNNNNYDGDDPVGIGTLYADGVCRTVETNADVDATVPAVYYDRLPGHYRATCTAEGKIRFEDSGCDYNTCAAPAADPGATGACQSGFVPRNNAGSSLYARLDPPEYTVQPPRRGKSTIEQKEEDDGPVSSFFSFMCYHMVGSGGALDDTTLAVTFAVFGNCSACDPPPRTTTPTLVPTLVPTTTRTPPSSYPTTTAPTATPTTIFPPVQFGGIRPTVQPVPEWVPPRTFPPVPFYPSTPPPGPASGPGPVPLPATTVRTPTPVPAPIFSPPFVPFGVPLPAPVPVPVSQALPGPPVPVPVPPRTLPPIGFPTTTTFSPTPRRPNATPRSSWPSVPTTTTTWPVVYPPVADTPVARPVFAPTRPGEPEPGTVALTISETISVGLDLSPMTTALSERAIEVFVAAVTQQIQENSPTAKVRLVKLHQSLDKDTEGDGGNDDDNNDDTLRVSFDLIFQYTFDDDDKDDAPKSVDFFVAAFGTERARTSLLVHLLQNHNDFESLRLIQVVGGPPSNDDGTADTRGVSRQALWAGGIGAVASVLILAVGLAVRRFMRPHKSYVSFVDSSLRSSSSIVPLADVMNSSVQVAEVVVRDEASSVHIANVVLVDEASSSGGGPPHAAATANPTNAVPLPSFKDQARDRSQD